MADVESMSSSFRCEIVEGVLYMPPMPFWPHPSIVSRLLRILGAWVDAHELGEVLAPQTGLYLNEINYLDPDLPYLRSSQVPHVGGRATEATLAVEVLSPGNIRAPREAREELFRQAGVVELWCVSFSDRRLEVRRLGPAGYETTDLFQDGDVVTSVVFPRLQFPLASLWRGVKA